MKKAIIKFLKKILLINKKNVSTLSAEKFLDWWSDYQNKNIQKLFWRLEAEDC